MNTDERRAFREFQERLRDLQAKLVAREIREPDATFLKGFLARNRMLFFDPKLLEKKAREWASQRPKHDTSVDEACLEFVGYLLHGGEAKWIMKRLSKKSKGREI